MLQLLLQRWRAELSGALVLGDTEVYLAAMDGEGKVGGLRGLEPAGLGVYDPQNNRVLC